MTPAELKEIIAKGEGVNTEFKRSFGRECIEAFYLTGDIEKYGSGFVRMRGYLKDTPGTSMTYREAGNGFEVVHLPTEVEPKAQVEAQVEAQVDWRILHACAEKPLSSAEIAAFLGHKQLSGNLRKVIPGMRDTGLLEYTHPEKPNSRLQKYRITDKGKRMLEASN